MNCEDSKNLMTISVYGKLTPSEKTQLETHLRECARCASIYEKAGKLSHLLNEKEDIPLPDKEKSWQIISTKAVKRKESRLDHFMPKKPVFQFSYVILLLVVGFAAGYIIRSHWQRDGELAQLHQEVLQIRQITAASLIRQESLNNQLRTVGMNSLLAHTDQGPIGSFLRTLRGETDVIARPDLLDDPYLLIRDPDVREEFIQSLSEKTSPLVEIALAFARHIEKSKL
jgi:hypothetical protein